jgi:cob(I)alamin adenosyltransferase
VTTRNGDQGYTTTFSGEKKSKGDVLFDVLGTLDELGAWLGIVKVGLRESACHTIFNQINAIQQILIRIGSQVATRAETAEYKKLDRLSQKDVEQIENWEKELLRRVNISDSFVLAGNTRQGAEVDVSRSVARRLERLYVIHAQHTLDQRDFVLSFLNRLSDYLFILARSLEKDI